MDSSTMSEIFRYLTSRSNDDKYMDDADDNHKRSIRRKATNFSVIDDQLYYMGGKNKQQRLVVESREEQIRIIKLIHEDGHLGFVRVFNAISRKYYWEKTMSKDILDFIKNCDRCQRSKPKLSKTVGELHPIPVISKTWHQIGIDFIGPLTTTAGGNKYILTVVDYFTKWPEATALPTKEANGVASFLLEIFCRFGFPKVIISDQGREFCNQLTARLFSLTNTQHRVTTAYHPQSNGLTERFNQTLSNSLRTKINLAQNDWDKHLPLILFAYRSTMQSSTKFSPFFMMYGKEPSYPIDVELHNEDEKDIMEFDDSTDDCQQAVNSLKRIHEFVHNCAEDNIVKSQKKQKAQYDMKHQFAPFAVGDQVLVENTEHKHRKGGKMNEKWMGPYSINSSLGKGVYQLKNARGNVLKSSYNVKRLKKYSSTSLTKPSGVLTEQLFIPSSVPSSTPTTAPSSITSSVPSSTPTTAPSSITSSVPSQSQSISKRSVRCKKCSGCLKQPCGKCRYCADSPKYGGPGKLKQSCIERQCVLLKNRCRDSQHIGTQAKKACDSNRKDPMDEFTNIPYTFNLSLNDVRSIYHDEWLTNFLIDYILNYMVANVANSSSSFTLISSVVFLKIINNYLDNIQAYLKNTSNIDHLDGILLPCLLKNHWILAVFWPKRRKISVMDSIGSYINLLEVPLRKLVHIMFGTEEGSDSWMFIEEANLPKQENGVDCGVFVCRYAFSVLKRHLHPITFDTNRSALRTWLLSMFVESLKSGNSTVCLDDILHDINTKSCRQVYIDVLHEAQKQDTSVINEHENVMDLLTNISTDINDDNFDEMQSDVDECFTAEEIYEKSPTRLGLLIPDFHHYPPPLTCNTDIHVISDDHCWGRDYYITSFPKLDRSEDDKATTFTRKFIRETIKDNESLLREYYHGVRHSLFQATSTFRDDFWPIDLFDMVTEINFYLKGLEMDIYKKKILCISAFTNNVVWSEILTLLIMEKFNMKYNDAVNCVLNGKMS